VYHFPDSSVHPVALSVDHLGSTDQWLREMAWSVNQESDIHKEMRQVDEGFHQLPHIYDYLLFAICGLWADCAG